VDYGDDDDDDDSVLDILFCVLFSDRFACFLALGWRWKKGFTYQDMSCSRLSRHTA
jgi:hypothetical protein